MTISTLDGLLAGLRPPLNFWKSGYTGEAAGRMHNLLAITGNPAAAVLGTPGMAGATVSAGDAIGGMFDFSNPASGNAYLAKMNVGVGLAIVGIILYDLLWYQSGIVVTTVGAQAINSVAWPSRCPPTPDTNGAGIEILLHAQVATTNAGIISNTTLDYTNQAGTAGRTGTLLPSWPVTGVAGLIVPFGMQGNDTGVRSIQNITLGTSYVAGTINLMAVRRIAEVGLPAAQTGVNVDAFGLGMPQLFNGSALYLANLINTTSAGENVGTISLAHG